VNASLSFIILVPVDLSALFNHLCVVDCASCMGCVWLIFNVVCMDSSQ